MTHSVPDVDTPVDIYRQQRVDKVHVRDEHYSTKITRKYPGFVVVRNNHDQVMSLVGEINRLRDKFADAVKLSLITGLPVRNSAPGLPVAGDFTGVP